MHTAKPISICKWTSGSGVWCGIMCGKSTMHSLVRQ